MIRRHPGSTRSNAAASIGRVLRFLASSILYRNSFSTSITGQNCSCPRREHTSTSSSRTGRALAGHSAACKTAVRVNPHRIFMRFIPADFPPRHKSVDVSHHRAFGEQYCKSRRLSCVMSHARARTTMRPPPQSSATARCQSARLATTRSPSPSGTPSMHPARTRQSAPRECRRGERPALCDAVADSATRVTVTPPPHGFSRGCEPRLIATTAPRRAASAPARSGGPPPDDDAVRG